MPLINTYVFNLTDLIRALKPLPANHPGMSSTPLRTNFITETSITITGYRYEVVSVHSEFRVSQTPLINLVHISHLFGNCQVELSEYQMKELHLRPPECDEEHGKKDK